MLGNPSLSFTISLSYKKPKASTWKSCNDNSYLYRTMSLKTSLERKFSNFSYISFLGLNFKNLTVEFHFPYILNMHIKFCLNQILFNIRSINIFLYIILYHRNLKFYQLFDDIAINFWPSWNYGGMNDIIKTFNPIVRFSKFTLNIKIYKEFERFLSKLVWKENLFIYIGKMMFIVMKVGRSYIFKNNIWLSDKLMKFCHIMSWDLTILHINIHFEIVQVKASVISEELHHLKLIMSLLEIYCLPSQFISLMASFSLSPIYYIWGANVSL